MDKGTAIFGIGSEFRRPGSGLTPGEIITLAMMGVGAALVIALISHTLRHTNG